MLIGILPNYYTSSKRMAMAILLKLFFECITEKAD